MTASRSVTSAVQVAVDPATAFAVFTEEVDCWWVQGPINFYDSSRAYGMRIEPGVGGRIVEVYDRASGEGLELARVTVWEPGARLAWRSMLDDVEIDVRFDGSRGGTRVSVHATVREGGVDRGGTSWVHMTPVWLGDWIGKRGRVPHEPLRLARLAIAVHYSKPATAARWLRDVFGFEPAGNIPETVTDDEHTWIEFHVGNCSLMVFQQTGDVVENAPVTHTPWVFVDDLDPHFARAKEGGARIVQEIWQHGAARTRPPISRGTTGPSPRQAPSCAEPARRRPRPVRTYDHPRRARARSSDTPTRSEAGYWSSVLLNRCSYVGRITSRNDSPATGTSSCSS